MAITKEYPLKICPLAYACDEGDRDFELCVEEKCAQWDFETNMCAMLLMARSLAKIYRYGIGTENKKE